MVSFTSPPGRPRKNTKQALPQALPRLMMPTSRRQKCYVKENVHCMSICIHSRWKLRMIHGPSFKNCEEVSALSLPATAFSPNILALTCHLSPFFGMGAFLAPGCLFCLFTSFGLEERDPASPAQELQRQRRILHIEHLFDYVLSQVLTSQ